MKAMTSQWDPNERTANDAGTDAKRSGCAMRYRGVTYLHGDLPRPIPLAFGDMIYRGVRYRARLPRRIPTVVPGQRRYRGAAY
ncbi:DUF4278 domain-containing protein [Rhodobacteraceae bacterium DSL-40]|uniref:DUF4278 domain-containing protein n=1 Tax=Amaricoccus sp. B4 TaxID=3368557 RepID=UPI000DAF2D11